MAQVMSMVQALQQVQMQQQAPARPPPPPPPKVPRFPDPRVGGQDSTGVWTGFGKQQQGKKPKSQDCYRDFKFAARDKAITMTSKIEKEIRQGNPDSDYEFTMPLEGGKNKASLLEQLKSFEKFAIDFGLEGVFHLIRRDGITVNMFKEPGKLTEAIVITWCDDLAKGVVTSKDLQGNPIRRNPCDYDEAICELTSDALKNSSSIKMQNQIDRHATGTFCVGPFVLWTIINASQVSSSEVIRKLCGQLKHISVKEISGENINEFSIKALEKVDEIRSKCFNDEPDDLTQLCLFNLSLQSSDEGIRSTARDLIRAADKVGSTLTPEQAMKEMVSTYDGAVSRGLYGPHQALGTASGFTASASSPGPAPAPALTAAPVGSPLDPQMLATMTAAVTAATAALERTSSTYQGRGRGQGRYARDSNGSSGGNNNSTSGGNGSSSSNGQQNRRGMTEEESRRVNQLVNDYQLPAFNNISDTDKIEVKDPNTGEVVGMYCKKCRRLIKKGPSMHWTGTHRSRRSTGDGNGNNTNTTNNNTTTSNNNNSNNGVTEAHQAAITAAVLQALQATQAPAPAPSSGASLLQLRGTNYETPVRPTNMFLCSSLAGYLPDGQDDDEASFASASSQVKE